MKYAVIQIAGKQYKVAEGEKLIISALDTEVGKTVDVSDVLLTVDGDKLAVGTPMVKGASVALKVVDQGKGEKIRVAKFRSKSRYRRVRGHRQMETTVEVLSIK
jgi:large subunit ribosomal protein L21